MKTRIKATAPTVYQIRSLGAFNFDNQKSAGGAYIGWSDFNTKKEALAYLRARAELYYEDRKQLREALKDAKRGVLTLDAVTAYCEPINKNDE